jgi:hypothetical protein
MEKGPMRANADLVCYATWCSLHSQVGLYV